MGAQKTGGGTANRDNKNKAMASRMKGHYENGVWIKGVERHSCNCPMCHKSVNMAHLHHHLGGQNCK